MTVVEGNDPFTLDSKSIIAYPKENKGAEQAAVLLASLLKKSAGLSLALSTDPAKGTIRFALLENGSAEGYELTVTKERIIIAAATPAGFFYGVQTLRQLLPASATFDGRPDVNASYRIPAMSIQDEPRFSWRGLHLDVCRHYSSIESIKQILDMMASLKLNTFHWHLTEDQAWRIEIKKYPKLTEIGAWRDGIGFELNPKDTTHYRADGKYGGFYTQDQVKEIVAYAAERHITVVPEIELPGHAMAALVAFPEFSCTGGPFTIPQTAGVFNEVYCAGNEEAMKFLEDILTEVADLFPSTFFHIGGDECKKDRWKRCPKCKARIKAEGLKNENELQSYVIHRMAKVLAGKGKRLIGWGEINDGGLPPNAIVMKWRHWVRRCAGIAAAQKGHDVVMSPYDLCYFDHAQAEQGEPKATGGFLSFEKAYRFDPMPGKLPADKRKHILGGQANVWTEWMPNEKHIQYMIAPRICALSEAVWSPKENRDWYRFRVRMADQYPRFQAMNFNYRAPNEITIKEVNNQVSLTPDLVGATVYYTLDGSEPTKAAPRYTKPLMIREETRVKACVELPDGTLSQSVSKMVVRDPYTVKSTLGQRDADNVYDYSLDTVYSGKKVKPGDTVTLSFPVAKVVKSLRVLTGNDKNGGGGDRLQQGVLEVSTDGNTFTELCSFNNGIAEIMVPPVPAVEGQVPQPSQIKAIRIRSTGSQKRLIVREIIIGK